jgi:Neu-associated kinase
MPHPIRPGSYNETPFFAKVAMKVIDKKKALQDPYVAKNFKREARLLQMVKHQNILQLLEVIETDSSFYLITELCSGQ